MADGLYIKEQLMVLGVMLSDGTNEQKADTIFNHMDGECAKKITAEQYTALLETMFTVAISHNSNLGTGNVDQGFVAASQI